MSGRSSDNSTDHNHNNESNRSAGHASSSHNARSSDVRSWQAAQVDAVGNGSVDKIWHPIGLSEMKFARRRGYRLFKSVTGAIDDIGGMAEIMNTVWNTIRYPIDRPESCRHIRPTKGLILHGEGGVGKTMLIRALAEGCNNYNPKMAAIDGKLYLNSEDLVENNLVKLFNAAKQLRPSIIFLDMFDGYFCRGGPHVRTLANLMDDLDDSGSVFVVAATDQLHRVDPEMRKPGRFGTEIVIELPNLEARKDILCKMTKKWRLHPSVIDTVAIETPDFTGGDLMALCRATFMNVLERAHQNSKNYAIYGDIDAESIDSSTIMVGMDDFKEALRTVQSTQQQLQTLLDDAGRSTDSA